MLALETRSSGVQPPVSAVRHPPQGVPYGTAEIPALAAGGRASTTPNEILHLQIVF